MSSVKVMLSYDYNHFEICLSVDENATTKEVNEKRKEAQRLCDEAVRQYKIAKIKAEKRCETSYEFEKLSKEVRLIKNNKIESEFTAEDKAKIKALDDADYWNQNRYDYEDDDDILF
jgi:hypothetical protein